MILRDIINRLFRFMERNFLLSAIITICFSCFVIGAAIIDPNIGGKISCIGSMLLASLCFLWENEETKAQNDS
jgi:amino acid permease